MGHQATSPRLSRVELLDRGCSVCSTICGMSASKALAVMESISSASPPSLPARVDQPLPSATAARTWFTTRLNLVLGIVLLLYLFDLVPRQGSPSPRILV